MEKIKVEVVFCDEDGKQNIDLIELANGSIVKDAIAQTSFFNDYSFLSSFNYSIGIFGQECDFTYVLKDMDRVEIYRELKVDPKQKRKIKAKQQGFSVKALRKKKGA